MDFSEEEVAKFQLCDGDILVCEGGDIGRTAVWRHSIIDCCYQNHLHRLRTKIGDYDSDFFAFWMQTGWKLFKIYGGEGNRTTIPNLSKSRLQSFEIPQPPLPEQRTIATVLSKFQDAIAAQQEIIDRTRELKKALMAKLFTEGLRGEPTKETEIGPIPESWEVVKIDDVCRQISVGIVVKPAQYYVEEGVPCFRSANIKPDYLNDTNLVYISEGSNKLLAKSILRAGDILFVRTGYPGTACVVPEKYDGANCIDLIFARPKSIVTSQYLSRFINSDAGRKQVIVGNNSAQQHFNVGAVKQMLIPLPSLEEQKLLSEIVESVDDRINVTDQKVNAFKDLFKTMLHELMTGNIRTTPLMEA